MKVTLELNNNLINEIAKYSMKEDLDFIECVTKLLDLGISQALTFDSKAKRRLTKKAEANE